MNKIFLEQTRKIKKETLRFKNSKKALKNNKNFFLETDNLYFNYSRNIVDKKTLSELLKLANIIDIKNSYKKLINGYQINTSEQRKVLHPALRGVTKSLDKSIVKNIDSHKKILKKNIK